MKYLLFLFVLLFVVSACDSSDQFASISDSAIEGQQASQIPEYQEKLRSIVKSDVKLKIGGKKRKNINVAETVGKKNLSKQKKHSIVTNIITDGKKEKVSKKEETKKRTVSKKKVSRTYIELKISHQTKRASKRASKPEKKLDLLFYMNDRDSGCVQHIRAFSEEKGFLKFLNHLDWQVSFSYYTQGDVVAMLPLEWNNGQAFNASDDPWKFKPDYVLSKREYSQKQADHLFNTTLQAFHPPETGEEGLPASSIGLNVNPKLYWAVLNPLSGLDRILSKKTKGAVRSNSHVVVLVFGYDFAYYSSVEWKRFFKKHKNVSVIAMSGRSANVSNFLHVLERKEFDFEFLAACDNISSPKQLVRTIQRKIQ